MRVVLLVALLACGVGDVRGAEDGQPAAATDLPAPPASATKPLSREAWWTGSLLSASAGTMPVGHWLVEPYVVDSHVDAAFDADGHRHEVSSVVRDFTAAYVMYGLADGVSIGVQPRALLGARNSGDPSSSAAVGDLTLMLQVRLSRSSPGSWRPATSIVLSETLPTGRYDRLGASAVSASGAGAHRTDLGFYAQSVGDVLGSHPLRARLNATVGWSDHPDVVDLSVYGTPQGFRGHARPGRWVSVDTAFEFSVSRQWVLALDLVYQGQASTIVEGQVGTGSDRIRTTDGTSRAWAVAPAVEYNFNARFGLIAGYKATLAGRNATADRTGAIALNMVF